jgi:hypothetical protein
MHQFVESFQVRKVGELLGAGRNFSAAIQVAQNSTSLPQLTNKISNKDFLEES